MQKNFERMLALVGEVFDVKNDPSQLDVTPAVMEQLAALHPATMSEVSDEHGPILWLLGIPTTTDIMQNFLEAEISEQQLLDMTHPWDNFEAIYMCSATVLPEHRHKGLASKKAIEVINKIKADYPIKALYYWKFSNEGEWLANSISKKTGLPVYERC